MKKVFISYSHQEFDCAKGVTRFLKMQGHDVWIDDERLLYGQDWAHDIDSAIINSDIMVSIISRNSARREEVFREILEAMKRVESEKEFRIIFLVIGNFHKSWFIHKNQEHVDNVSNFISKMQYIQLDSKGRITLDAMRNLSNAIDGKPIHMDDLVLSLNTDYIYEVGSPEKVYDSNMENIMYRVHPSDLAPSATFPFALDNQWLPYEIIDENSKLKSVFMEEGFSSDDVKKYLDRYQMNNLFLSLLHARQVIINRASVLNSHSLSQLYCSNEYHNVREKEAFFRLLENGSIVIFLYGDNEISPYVKQLPKYSTNRDAVIGWNNLCEKLQLYCIRENWESPTDKHSQDLAKHCTTLAFNSELNNMLAECFGFAQIEKENFMVVLKEIEMTVFLQTHIIGTGYRSLVKGYSRSSFYKSFVVLEKDSTGKDTVLNCLFDIQKPFCMQLKKMIDVYYNSIFTNYFRCTAFLPNDARPEDTFINQLYLTHGEKEVSSEELKYAFSVFFDDMSIFDAIKELGRELWIDNWSLDKISKFRQSGRWLEYVELKEYIVNRSSTWKIDFSDVKKLVELFVSSVKSVSNSEDSDVSQSEIPAYTFRVCIGSKVLDIICTGNVKKIREYKGDFLSEKQNNLIIQFLLGDTTSKSYSMSDVAFSPIKIFDGLTNYVGGKAFFDDVYNFLVRQYDFLMIS